jgi:hypothetical protein
MVSKKDLNRKIESLRKGNVDLFEKLLKSIFENLHAEAKARRLEKELGDVRLLLLTSKNNLEDETISGVLESLRHQL